MLNCCNSLLCFQPYLYSHSMSGQKFSLTKHRTFLDRHTCHRWHGKYQPVMTLCCLRPKLDLLYSQYKFSFFQRISCFKLWHKILLGGLTAVLPSKIPITGKSLSGALLFAEHGGEHVVYRNCFWHSEEFLYTTWSPHVLQKEELLTKIYL